MPCGQQLIEAVASHLSPDEGSHCGTLLYKVNRPVTMRAIRYAIAELIRSGRARRDGKYGPVYAVKELPTIEWHDTGKLESWTPPVDSGSIKIK